MEMFAEWLLWPGLLMKMLMTFGSVTPMFFVLLLCVFSCVSLYNFRVLDMYDGLCIYRGVRVQ